MNYVPRPYQAYAESFVLEHAAAGLFLDMGLGKTAITLSACEKLLRDRFEVDRPLVIAEGRRRFLYRQSGERRLAGELLQEAVALRYGHHRRAVEFQIQQGAEVSGLEAGAAVYQEDRRPYGDSGPERAA